MQLIGCCYPDCFFVLTQAGLQTRYQGNVTGLTMGKMKHTPSALILHCHVLLSAEWSKTPVIPIANDSKEVDLVCHGSLKVCAHCYGFWGFFNPQCGIITDVWYSWTRPLRNRTIKKLVG